MHFKEIAVSDRKMFDEYIFKLNFITCEFAFANLFCLRKKYGTEICFEDDFMFIRQTTKSNTKAFYYFMPIGKGDLNKAFEKINEDARDNGKEFVLWGVTDKVRNIIEEVLPGDFSFETNRDWAEYVYLSERLINLQGSDLKRRRNILANFKRKYEGSYQFQPITSEKDLADALEYHQKWFNDNYEENEESSFLLYENKIIQEAFENWAGLGLTGALCKMDDEVVGYTYGKQTYSNTLDIFVEKADFKINGLYQAINRDFADFACNGAEYINREEDLGIEGLRIAKMSYRPEKLLTKYLGIYKG